MNKESTKRRDKNKIKILLRSLSRNEASIVGNKTILKVDSSFSYACLDLTKEKI